MTYDPRWCRDRLMEVQELSDDAAAINSTNTLTHFTFTRFLPVQQCMQSGDGRSDFQAETESPYSECTVKLEHSNYTDIESVGLQIWDGALLLSDFVIHCGNSILHNKNVLELASGTGLVGLIAGMYCSRVTVTDVDDAKILQTIRTNVRNNQHLINAAVSIQAFDFYDQWSSDALGLVSNADIILVSEVIYDNRLTDAFIEQLIRIFNVNPKVNIYVSIEKRYIFSAVNLRIEATHYEYFFERIRAKQRILKLDLLLKRMKVDFPQYFNYYKRSKHLQLWRISKKI